MFGDIHLIVIYFISLKQNVKQKITFNFRSGKKIPKIQKINLSMEKGGERRASTESKSSRIHGLLHIKL